MVKLKCKSKCPVLCPRRRRITQSVCYARHRESIQ